LSQEPAVSRTARTREHSPKDSPGPRAAPWVPLFQKNPERV